MIEAFIYTSDTLLYFVFLVLMVGGWTNYPWCLMGKMCDLFKASDGINVSGIMCMKRKGIILESDI